MKNSQTWNRALYLKYSIRILFEHLSFFLCSLTKELLVHNVCLSKKGTEKQKRLEHLTLLGLNEAMAAGSKVSAAVGQHHSCSPSPAWVWMPICPFRTGFCSPLSCAKWDLKACSSLSTQFLLRPTETAIWRQLTAAALLNSLLYMVWQIILPIIILNDRAQGSAGE